MADKKNKTDDSEVIEEAASVEINPIQFDANGIQLKADSEAKSVEDKWNSFIKKINSVLGDSKSNYFNELLTIHYPYDFGDDNPKMYTLQEVLFRLYNEYVVEAEKWAEIQNEKKDELRKKYPRTDADSDKRFNTAYIEWYETVAENYTGIIMEKISKILSLFIVNDMKILEDVFKI